MIVRQERAEAAALCIPQYQHAGISGQLARAWGNESFAAPSPRAAVCLAAERHDDGMKPFDQAPERDPETGLPRDFMRMPLELWLECWRRGPAEVGADDPYAGILVSLHGEYLVGYRRRAAGDDPEAGALLDRYVDEQRGLRERLATAADRRYEPCLDEGSLETNRALIAAWDAISLALCMPRLPDDFEVPGERGPVAISAREVGDPGVGQALVEVDPWPFSAAEVPLAAVGRRLSGPARDQRSLLAELAAAPAVTLRATLKPRL